MQKGEIRMHPVYEKTERGVRALQKESEHVGPHLHRAIEFVYVTKGCLELGVQRELYHMEEGDFGIVFPDLIHHYQVFSQGENTACHILAEPSVCAAYGEDLFKYSPKIPVIPKEKVEEELVHAVRHLIGERKPDPILRHAYVQILLAKSMPHLLLVPREGPKDEEVVDQMVAYISAHFRERITLSRMALDLGVGRYVLSRTFSGTFHRNFNQYLNETRLSYACELLEYTNRTITDICLDAGFDSQRTFHRVFKDYCHQTPREYRRNQRAKLLSCQPVSENLQSRHCIHDPDTDNNVHPGPESDSVL